MPDEDNLREVRKALDQIRSGQARVEQLLTELAELEKKKRALKKQFGWANE